MFGGVSLGHSESQPRSIYIYVYSNVVAAANKQNGWESALTSASKLGAGRVVKRVSWAILVLGLVQAYWCLLQRNVPRIWISQNLPDVSWCLILGNISTLLYLFHSSPANFRRMSKGSQRNSHATGSKVQSKNQSNWSNWSNWFSSSGSSVSERFATGATGDGAANSSAANFDKMYSVNLVHYGALSSMISMFGFKTLLWKRLSGEICWPDLFWGPVGSRTKKRIQTIQYRLQTVENRTFQGACFCLCLAPRFRSATVLLACCCPRCWVSIYSAR